MRIYINKFLHAIALDDLKWALTLFSLTRKWLPYIYERVFGNSSLYLPELSKLAQHSVFNLGVNMKGFVGSDMRHTYLNLGSTVVGADVAVPITFRFGNKRHWDLRLEPFGIYIHGSRGSQLYFGGRSTIGYRF
jgi:hypothetical protein